MLHVITLPTGLESGAKCFNSGLWPRMPPPGTATAPRGLARTHALTRPAPPRKIFRSFDPQEPAPRRGLHCIRYRISKFLKFRHFTCISGDFGEVCRYIPCLVGEVGGVGVVITSLSIATLFLLLGGESGTGSVSGCSLFILGTRGMAGSMGWLDCGDTLGLIKGW